MSSSMIPWVLGRGLGLAALASLLALTITGLWMRHPARLRWSFPKPQTMIWLHAMLAAATGVLLVGHIGAIALDHYAGVGWTGAFIPGQSSYRPLAVSLGVIGMYVGLLVAGAVLLAGRLAGRRWLPIHRLASGAFVLVWLHAVLAGSDSSRLRWVYVGSAVVVGGLAMTRRFMRTPLALEEAKVAS